MDSSKKPFPIHTIILSIYPVLMLMGFNMGEFQLEQGLRPLVIAFLVGMVFWLLAQLLIRDWAKSGLVAALGFIFFYSYGHIYILIKSMSIGGFIFGRHRYLLPVMVMLLGVGIYWVVFRAKRIGNITSALNGIAIVLVIFPIFQIISYELTAVFARMGDEDTAVVELAVGEDGQDIVKRDVYYIILDGYTRQDTLRELYGFDNSEFIQELEELGFYVAKCSQSNYPKTIISVPSTLNMNYEEDFWTHGNYEQKAMQYYFHNSLIRKSLVSQGYITVSFESGSIFTEIKDAEVFFSGVEETGLLASLATLNLVSDFENQILETTLFSILDDVQVATSQFRPEAVGFERKRNRVLFALDQLPNVPNIEGPKFVFAHIVSPHRPFVFGPNGEEILGADGQVWQDEDHDRGYINQVIFLNQRVIPMLREIIENSEVPPIIIVQGDHGPPFVGDAPRSTILNAFYLPDGGNALLYPDISPVNSFRIVLNYYFGADLPLLEDIHWFSTPEGTPDTYVEIPNPYDCASP